MKKIYSKPEIKVINIKPLSMLMTSGEVGTTGVGMKWDTNADSGEGLARRSRFSTWEEEDE